MSIYDFRKKQICWTTTPYSTQALNEMPYVEMIGYQQDWSQTIAAINNWFKRATDGVPNPFTGLYMGTPADTYILPYFSEYHHEITQNWQENQGPLGPAVAEALQFAENVAKAFLPAAGVVTPRSWAGGGAASYSFTVNLINTNGGANPDAEIPNGIEKNRAFLESFIKANLHEPSGALSLIPPLIYEVYIPGVRYSPAAVVSNLSVKNKGSLNTNVQGTGVKNYVYPDAWEVTVTVTELITETKGIYGDSIKGRASGAEMFYRAIQGG